MAEPDVIPSEQMYADALARARAAEVRVEALREALRVVAADPLATVDLRRVARAALACPPQQPQKAGVIWRPPKSAV